MLSNRTTNAVALIALLGTIWTSVATSTADGGFYGTYRVRSDCVAPTFDEDVTVGTTNNQITSPSGLDYLDLGFPSNTLKLGDKNSGTMSNGSYRVCENTFKDGIIDDSFLYSCSDSGSFVCNIYFEAK